MGQSDGFSGSGILGTITFTVVGDLPTSLQILKPTLRGFDGETAVIGGDLYIGLNDGGNF